jgi:DNA-binding winged helix-turn-helix (wHTH) protein/tetratricopeptide (TPR) repeat protein
MPTVDAGRRVRFGTFELELDVGGLYRNGRRIPLQEQPARILALLVSRPGQLVTREELRHRVWSDDTFVEFDASLNAAITKARRALGDSATAPRFIETVPRQGYRFLADVHGLPSATESAATAMVPLESVERTQNVSPPIEHRHSGEGLNRTRKAVLLGIVVATIVAAGLLFRGLVRPTPVPLVRSLTVQPFEVHAEDMHPNLGSELATAIARRIGRLQTLTVKPWPPNVGDDPRAISRDLGVEARLTGVATRTGEQLAIALRIVSTNGERVLWEDVAGLPVNDLMWLESQVAQRVGAALNVPTDGRERAALARHMTENFDAYQWFLRGRLHFERRTVHDLREAIAAFERATASDPNYALAYAWVANAYSPLSYLGFAPPWETGPAQRAAAEKALLLDASLAEAHLGLALSLAFHEQRWADAEATYRRALELDPNYATGHHWYAFFLQTLGRFDEALDERRRALDIDPLTPMLGVGLAGLYLAMRQPDQAIIAAERVLDRYPRYWYARLNRGQALEQLGRHQEALRDFMEVERTTPDNFMVAAAVAGAVAATGDVREARRRVLEAERLARARFVPAFELGVMRIALGDIDLAFDRLRQSCDAKEPQLTSIGFHFAVDKIRIDPRFSELLACVGLPPSLQRIPVAPAR